MSESKIAKKMLVVALGSNIGNRYAYLFQAKRLLGKKLGRAYKYSGVYETPPWGKTNQASFLNSVACFSTDLPAEECMEICLNVEQQLGRSRIEKWGERTIDLDILFYGGEAVNQEKVVIPHPEITNRSFVLRPLVEIIPSFVHPVLGVDVNTLFGQFDGEKDFELFSSCF
ncbi:MAG: 2-amino-4-hydroxy-6-hydroxymethyldihydropteridine diphosphokinase [Bacteroidia bacterium]